VFYKYANNLEIFNSASICFLHSNIN